MNKRKILNIKIDEESLERLKMILINNMYDINKQKEKTKGLEKELLINRKRKISRILTILQVNEWFNE